MQAAQTGVAISSELAATRLLLAQARAQAGNEERLSQQAARALAAARAELTLATGDLGEILRLVEMTRAQRDQQPNHGKTAAGRAAIARLLHL